MKNHLEKEIDPSKSVLRVKKNKLTIALWKKDKDATWMNLTAKNPTAAPKPNAADPTAGIMDLMKVRVHTPQCFCVWSSTRIACVLCV